MSNFGDRENKRKSIVKAIMSEQPTEATEIIPEQTSLLADTKQENKGIKIKPKEKEETRSKRINLLITPTVYLRAQKKCKSMGISLNECVNQFLSSWAEQ